MAHDSDLGDGGMLALSPSRQWSGGWGRREMMV